MINSKKRAGLHHVHIWASNQKGKKRAFRVGLENIIGEVKASVMLCIAMLIWD